MTYDMFHSEVTQAPVEDSCLNQLAACQSIALRLQVKRLQGKLQPAPWAAGRGDGAPVLEVVQHQCRSQQPALQIWQVLFPTGKLPCNQGCVVAHPRLGGMTLTGTGIQQELSQACWAQCFPHLHQVAQQRASRYLTKCM